MPTYDAEKLAALERDLELTRNSISATSVCADDEEAVELLSRWLLRLRACRVGGGA